MKNLRLATEAPVRVRSRYRFLNPSAWRGPLLRAKRGAHLERAQNRRPRLPSYRAPAMLATVLVLCGSLLSGTAVSIGWALTALTVCSTLRRRGSRLERAACVAGSAWILYAAWNAASFT